MDSMIKYLQQEQLESLHLLDDSLNTNHSKNDAILSSSDPNSTTGPCLEYMLQKRLLEEMVEYTRIDVCILSTLH